MRLLVIIACIVAVTGCNRGYRPKACAEPREYHKQTSIPPLRVPEGLDPPAPNAGVQIPALPGDEQGESPQGSCLENPPDYFDTSPT